MFCIVIAESSWRQIFDRLQSESVHTDLFEIRLDFLDEQIDERNLEKLFSLPHRFICTYRDYREGGRRKVSPAERWRILELCGRLGAFLIDFEWKALKEIKSPVRSSSLFPEKVLISYHNYEKTPSSGTLRKLLHALKSEGVKWAKVATFARDLAETLRVLSLIVEGKELGLEVIAFGMGDGAKLSRVLNLIVGSPFTYVFSGQGSPVAPGQLAVEEAKRLYEVLSNV